MLVFGVANCFKNKRGRSTQTEYLKAKSGSNIDRDDSSFSTKKVEPSGFPPELEDITSIGRNEAHDGGVMAPLPPHKSGCCIQGALIRLLQAWDWGTTSLELESILVGL